VQVAVAKRAGAPSWVNLRTTLGLLLFLISLVSGSAVLTAADDGTWVWAARRDLAEGAVLRTGDLVAVAVALPQEQLGSYLGASTQLSGTALVRPLRKGELIPAGWVAEEGAGSSRSIAVPITADHAVGGELRPGDRVDVFATLRGVRGGARTTLLVSAAEVEGLLRSEGMVMENDSFAGITLSVSPDDAAKIAFAIRTSDIDLVRVEGSTQVNAVTSITSGDL
jgi:Flp pilus assembly protein CpaB